MNRSRTRRCVTFVAVASLAFVGCDEPSGGADDVGGGDSDVTDSGADSDPDADADSSAEAEAEAEAEADADAAGDGGGGSWTYATMTLSFRTLGLGITGGVVAAFCRCDPPLPDDLETLATDGDCRIVRSIATRDWSGCTPLDVGNLSVRVESTDYALERIEDDPAIACVWQTVAGGISVPPVGTEIHFLSTGGTDVPSFDTPLDMPMTAMLTAPAADATFTAGDPWAIAWTPEAADWVWAVARGEDYAVECRTAGSSPLTIPGTLTDLWDEAVSGNVSVTTFSDVNMMGAIPVVFSVRRSGGSADVTFATGD